MFCKYCGSSNDDAAVYCVRCGKIIGSPAAPAEEEKNIPAKEAIPTDNTVNAVSTPAAQTSAPAQTTAAKNEKPAKAKRSKKSKTETGTGTEQPLRKFKKALAIFSFILALLSFNWLSNIFSVIAITRGAKYKNAVAAENPGAANKAAKAAMVLSVISIILSLLTIAAITALVWWALRYTNIGLLF